MVIGIETADFGHGRDFDLVGCGGISAAWREQLAGLHRGDALRIPDYRRFVRRTFQLDGRKRIQEGIRRRGEKRSLAFPTSRTLICRFKAVARIDQQKCIRCNLCYVACNDTAHQCIDLVAKDGSIVPPGSLRRAFEWKRGGGAHAPERHRARRGLRRLPACASTFARSTDCISMVEEPSGRPSVTWDEISQKQPEVTEDWEKMKAYREKMGIHIH